MGFLMIYKSCVNHFLKENYRKNLKLISTIVFRPQLINIFEFSKFEARFVISIKIYRIYVSLSEIPELGH
jgi:hypothetical protein